jgi:hypothetical protein
VLVQFGLVTIAQASAEPSLDRHQVRVPGFTSGSRIGTSGSLRKAKHSSKPHQPASANIGSISWLSLPAGPKDNGYLQPARFRGGKHQILAQKWHGGGQEPAACLGVGFTVRALRAGEAGDSEPGMPSKSWTKRCPTMPVAP